VTGDAVFSDYLNLQLIRSETER